jgi:hypothetical protein
MFCPVCRDEYRPGFTRCATCDVPLVPELGAHAPSAPAAVIAEAAPEEAMVTFCGFLTLEEARQARDKIREAKLPSEILIREKPESSADGPAQEEFWLRVRPRDFAKMEALIGFEPAVAAPADDAFGCSACGATVHASDESCPGCGLRFEE